MNIHQQFVSVNWLALAVVVGAAGLSTACMTTTSTPADYKQSVLVMVEQQTLNPEAKDVPGAESMVPIDGTYEMSVINTYRKSVSDPGAVRSDIEFEINSSSGRN